MKIKDSSILLQDLIIIGLLLMSIFITSPISTDPLNLPRLTIVGTIATGLIYLLYINRHTLQVPKIILIISVLIFLNILAIHFFTQNPKIEIFYGISGSNIGTLSIISIWIFFLATIQVSSESFLTKILRILKIISLASITYSLFQAFNLDPLAWNNTYSPVIGFLGNPNFQSTFLGIVSLIYISGVLHIQKFQLKNIFDVIACGVIIFLLIKAGSTQGFVILFIGSLILGFFRYQEKNKRFAIFLLVSIPVSLFVGLLDLLRLVPWNSYFYEFSISARGDFWRAAIRMVRENPFLGIGFDRFRDNYFIYRDDTAGARDGASMVVRSSHNYLLDWASMGGIPFLVLNFSIVLLTSISAFRLVKAKSILTPREGVLVAMWAGYTVQGLISVQQLGILIWGWVFSGLIIGLDCVNQINTNPRKYETFRQLKVNKPMFLLILTIGFLISSPPLIQDVQFRNAIESTNLQQLISNASNFPKNTDLMNESIKLLLLSNNRQSAYELIQTAIRNNPKNFTSWELYSKVPNLTESEQKIIRENFFALNPNQKQILDFG